MGDEATPTHAAARRASTDGPGDASGPVAPLETEASVDSHGTPLLEVSGEVDLSNVAALRTVLDGVAAGHPGRLVLDMSGVTFIDSSGIHALIDAAQRIGSVSLRSPSWQVRRLVETMGLTSVLSLER